MTLRDINIWLIEFNTYSGIPGILYFLLFVRAWKSNVGIIFYILFASFAADLSNYFFIQFVYPNSFPISNSCYLVNYILMAWLFFQLLTDKRRIIYILLGLFSIGTIVSFNYYSFYESNTFIRVFTSISFVVLSLMAYFDILKKPERKLSNSPVFWLITGFFIYSALTLLKNLFLQYLVFDLQISRESFSIVSLINLFANIFKNFVLFYVIVLIDKGLPDSIPKPEKV